MATVADIARPGDIIDRPLSNRNRVVTGSPLGVTVPQFVGEIVQDTLNGALWFANGASSADWVQGAITH